MNNKLFGKTVQLIKIYSMNDLEVISSVKFIELISKTCSINVDDIQFAIENNNGIKGDALIGYVDTSGVMPKFVELIRIKI